MAKCSGLMKTTELQILHSLFIVFPSSLEFASLPMYMCVAELFMSSDSLTRVLQCPGNLLSMVTSGCGGLAAQLWLLVVTVSSLLVFTF